MHSIELIQIRDKNVYTLRIKGFVQADEMRDLLRQAEVHLYSPAPDFRLLSDTRGFKPATPDVQNVMKDIQELFKNKGMQKVALLVDNVVTKMQLQRLHGATGIKGGDRFFVAEEEGYQEELEQFLGE